MAILEKIAGDARTDVETMNPGKLAKQRQDGIAGPVKRPRQSR